MRDLALTLAFLLALTGAGAAAAGDMAGMKAAAPTSASAVKTGKGTGFIKAIDVRSGTVTLQHGPIAGLGWPAMTMTFKASPASLLGGLKVGERIGFDARLQGAAAEITAVRR
jgi:Cu(I)/Ag(I) efflux system protein CusF